MSEYESIQGTRVKYLTSDPTLDSSTEGQVWYNSTSGTNKALVQIKSFSSSGAIPTQFYYPGGVGGQTDTLGIAGVGPTPQPAHNLCIEYSGYTWRAQPNLNTNRRAPYTFGTSTSCVCSGGDYAPGSPTLTQATEEWDGSAWTSVTNMPNNQGSFGAASGTLTAGIVYGGYGNPQSASAKTVSYDGTNWTDLPSPGSDVNNARDFTRGGGGTQTAAIFSGGNPTTGATETFDGSSWSEQNNMVLARYGAGFIGTQTNGLYAGGAGAPGRTAVTEEWDGSVWTTCPASLSTARNGTIHSKSSGTAAVIAGGYTGSAYPTATEEFNSSINVETTGSWASGGSMNLDRSTGNILGTSTTSALYVGGYRGPTPSPPSFQGQTAVESYNGTSWTNSNALPVAFYSGFSMGTTTAGLRAGGAKSTAQYGPDPNSDESQEYNGSSWTSGGTMTQKQQLGASAGTQTAGLLWAGKSGAPPTTPTTVSQEYDGTSFTAGGSVPSVRIRTMGAGIQTAAINFGGHSGPPSQDLNQSATYDGSSWTTGPNMAIARNAAMGAGTSTLAICGGGYMYTPPPGNTTATEWWDGTSWSNIANNVVTGPKAFSGPSGTAATDCLAVEGPTGTQEWTGQPASTTTASTLTTS